MTNGDLEKTLWAAADRMRSNLDAASYKHIVLGLIFLKYISDAFVDHYETIGKGEGDYEFADPEDADEYIAEKIFFVPPSARWSYLQSRARNPQIGQDLDSAMDEIERINPSLRGVLPKIYGDQTLEKRILGDLIDLISGIGLQAEPGQRGDLLGRVYEYFLGQFADAEGKRGGQFYTARCVVQLLVEMLEPYRGRVYDGCCGSGGMFVQSEKFVEQHQGSSLDLSIYGQESNPTTLQLARMNLAIRRIDANLQLGDTLLNDLFPDLKVDFVLANPPFNMSGWGAPQVQEDIRWKFGAPPDGNANYAWLQHFVHKLNPNGTAGVVMANGSMNTNTSGEGQIRRNMVEGGVVDCIVALPGQLFYNTQIPVCLWFFARNRQNHKFRDRSNEILFLDAREMGTMINRRNKELTTYDIAKIAGTYHAWRGRDGGYEDVAGFCKSATIEEVRKNEYALMPGRYVGIAEVEDDGIPFEEKMAGLTVKLFEEFRKSSLLENQIVEYLRVFEKKS